MGDSMFTEINVRVGVPDDIHNCMDLAIKMANENAFVDVSPEKVLKEIWSALNLDNGIVGVIENSSNVIEGMILLRIGKIWYSNADVLEEKFVFIDYEFRKAKGGRASRLCEFAKKAADSMGLPLLIGVVSNQRTEAKVRLYSRQFGKPAGAIFLHNARTKGPLSETEQKHV
jgi:hypothetical protein